MITNIEEAMNLIDASRNTVTMMHFMVEAEPILPGVLYGIAQMLQRSQELLEAVEASGENSCICKEERKTGEAERQQITLQELLTRQFDESEDAEAAELEHKEGKPPEEKAGRAKVDLRGVHNLRMQGKKAKEIADGYGVEVKTVYGWFKQIKEKHPGWVEEWNRR